MEKSFPLLGETNSFFAADKKGMVQGLLQSGYGFGDRRLADIQIFSRFADIAAFGGFIEYFIVV